MYVPPEIMKIIKSERVLKLREEYERVLGVEVSPGFSFIDFGTPENYIATLEKCIREKKEFEPPDYDELEKMGIDH